MKNKIDQYLAANVFDNEKPSSLTLHGGDQLQKEVDQLFEDVIEPEMERLAQQIEELKRENEKMRSLVVLTEDSPVYGTIWLTLWRSICEEGEKMKCKREECKKQAHNLEAGYCSSICNIKALEQVIEQFKEELQWIK